MSCGGEELLGGPELPPAEPDSSGIDETSSENPSTDSAPATDTAESPVPNGNATDSPVVEGSPPPVRRSSRARQPSVRFKEQCISPDLSCMVSFVLN